MYNPGSVAETVYESVKAVAVVVGVVVKGVERTDVPVDVVPRYHRKSYRAPAFEG